VEGKSCFIIKPDRERCCIIAEDAIKIATELGLKTYFLGEKTLSLDEVIALYEDFQGDIWFTEFTEYLMSGEVKAYFTEGDNAIIKTLEVKRRIREKYAINVQKNAIHAPKREISVQKTRNLIELIFNPSNLKNPINPASK